MQRLLTGEVRFKEFGNGTLVSQNGGVKTPLPRGWKEVRLSDICNIKKGTQLNKSTLKKSGKYPVI